MIAFICWLIGHRDEPYVCCEVPVDAGVVCTRCGHSVSMLEAR